MEGTFGLVLIADICSRTSKKTARTISKKKQKNKREVGRSRDFLSPFSLHFP